MNQLVELPNNDLFVFDLRYRSPDNFSGQTLSVPVRPKLQQHAAEALLTAAQACCDDGYRMVIWDAYRPQHVQDILLTHEADRNYVASDSNHCKGLAVDLTLQTIDGEPLEMPTDYDHFQPLAHADYSDKDLSETARKNRDYLISQMKSAGFQVNPYEWWHFDYLNV